MSEDVHYLAEKYLLELMNAGAHLRKLERNEGAENPERYNVPDEPNNFVLTRGKSYFYGRHPKTNEPKWTYEQKLALVLVGDDADIVLNQLAMTHNLMRKLPARAQKEEAF